MTSAQELRENFPSLKMTSKGGMEREGTLEMENEGGKGRFAQLYQKSAKIQSSAPQTSFALLLP